MTEKFKNCVETAEIMINYAESIIEQEGVKADKQSNTPQKMSELRSHRSDEERTQKVEGEVDTNISVQKLYVPVFRLSQTNVRTNESHKT